MDAGWAAGAEATAATGAAAGRAPAPRPEPPGRPGAPRARPGLRGPPRAVGAAGAGLAAWAPRRGAAPPPTTAPMSSSGSAMTPISAPTGTAVPGVTRILRRTPEPNASSSTSALSVSISAMMSPPEIRSPSCLSHLMIFPVSIASDSFGITTLVTAMARSPSCGNGENRQTAQSLRIASTICCFDGVFSRSRFLA